MVPHYHPDTLSAAFEGLDIDSEGAKYENESETVKYKDENHTLFVDVEDITCPDNSTCPDGATCCKTLLRTWSCCPFQNATCCKDEVHCCPNKYQCDLANKRCTKKEELILNIEEIVARQEMDHVQNTSSADVCGPCSYFGETCCKYENIVYCCPQGSVCGKGERKCLEDKHNGKIISLPDGEEAIWNKVLGQSIVVCPDKTEACPSEQTCCKKFSGDYGCCDLPVATCCPDRLTCCPNGYVCAKDGCERLPSFRLFHLPIFKEKTPLK
ncbi:Granulin-1 [Armadillidium nasatum]|uniref:Granulin-1 n=1 Tax=Armadillidium nasatum TaxID=96803 RepID=A0A5N5TMH1_9CRUS|nr:Granulin-1 [Armadillidium nasatum]